MEDGTIGRRWARALVETVQEEADLRTIDEQLGALAQLMDQRGEAKNDLREAMFNPSFSREDRAKVIASLGESNKFHKTTRTFLALLVEKDRVPYLGSIARAFRIEVDERLGRVRAYIESANELKKNEVDDVVKALKKRTGKEVVPEVKTDPELIAGLRARIGGLVLDNTVRAKLDRLRAELR